jgi:hypothetical protein
MDSLRTDLRFAVRLLLGSRGTLQGVIVSTVRSSAARTALLAVLGISLAAACIRTRPYATLTGTAEPLRTAFNSDVGRVRVMMLVAPT